MTVTLSQAKYREQAGRDSMERASLWQLAAAVLHGLNRVTVDPVLATATVTSQVKTTGAAGFTVGGQLYSKAATDNFWTLSGAVVPINSWQKYLLMVSDAGAASVQEGVASSISAAAVGWGNVVAAAGANPKNPWAALCSVLNASRCIFGVVTVATNGSTTFTPGTTLLGAAGITTT